MPVGENEPIRVTLKVVMPERKIQVRHEIDVELHFVPSQRGMITVQGDLPVEMTRFGERATFVGSGRGVLGAVLNWLSRVDSSLLYQPAYDKASEGEK